MLDITITIITNSYIHSIICGFVAIYHYIRKVQHQLNQPVFHFLHLEVRSLCELASAV